MKLDTKEILRLGLILCVICLVSTALLAWVKEITAPKIVAQRLLAAEESRKEVLPMAETFEALDAAGLKKLQEADAAIVEVFVGKKGSAVVGYFVKAAPAGYAGGVEIMTGIDNDGTIVNVKMGRNSETPGLGTVIGEPAFTSQFKGKGTADSLEVIKTPVAGEKQIIAVTGATITSRCMTNGVNSAIKAVKALEK